MKRFLIAACCLVPVVLYAQTGPDFQYNTIVSATQWKAYFAGKVDYPLKAYTVATLPVCSTDLKGAFLLVTDATTPTYNAALVGAGAIVIPAMCDGSAWKSH